MTGVKIPAAMIDGIRAGLAEAFPSQTFEITTGGLDTPYPFVQVETYFGACRMVDPAAPLGFREIAGARWRARREFSPSDVEKITATVAEGRSFDDFNARFVDWIRRNVESILDDREGPDGRDA